MVGVVCPSPLDAGGDAPHCLDLRPWGLPASLPLFVVTYAYSCSFGCCAPPAVAVNPPRRQPPLSPHLVPRPGATPPAACCACVLCSPRCRPRPFQSLALAPALPCRRPRPRPSPALAFAGALLCRRSPPSPPCPPPPPLYPATLRRGPPHGSPCPPPCPVWTTRHWSCGIMMRAAGVRCGGGSRAPLASPGCPSEKAAPGAGGFFGGCGFGELPSVWLRLMWAR